MNSEKIINDKIKAELDMPVLDEIVWYLQTIIEKLNRDIHDAILKNGKYKYLVKHIRYYKYAFHHLKNLVEYEENLEIRGW